MSQLHLVHSEITGHRTQAEEINAFFSSGTGVATFACIWLFCVLTMFCVTAYVLSKTSEAHKANPNAAEEKANQGMLFANSFAADLPMDLRIPQFTKEVAKGRYYRLI